MGVKIHENYASIQIHAIFIHIYYVYFLVNRWLQYFVIKGPMFWCDISCNLNLSIEIWEKIAHKFYFNIIFEIYRNPILHLS